MEDFNKLADEWDDKAWAKDTKFNEYLKQFINHSPHLKLLDVGCGTGILTSMLGTNVYGCDISFEMLERNKLPFTRKKLMTNPDRLPYNDAMFDVVISRNLIKHLDKPEQMFQEMYRVLRVGGRLISIESCIFDGIDDRLPNHMIRITHKEKKPFMKLSDVAKLHTQPHIVRTYQWEGAWFKAWRKASKVSYKDAVSVYAMYLIAPQDFARSQNIRMLPDEIVSIIDFAIVESKKKR